MKYVLYTITVSILFIYPPNCFASALLLDRSIPNLLVIILLLALAVCVFLLRLSSKNTLSKLKREQILASKNYETLFSAAGFSIWEFDVSKNSIKASSSYDEMFGFEHTSQNQKTKWWSRLHPDDRAKTTKAWNDHLAGDTGLYQSVFRYRHPHTEKYHWFSAYGKVTKRTSDGKVLSVVGINKDISAEKDVQDQLFESQERLEHALSAANAGLWELNLINQQVNTDEIWAKMLGYSKQQLYTQFGSSIKHWHQLIHPDDKGKVDQCFREFIAGVSQQYRCEFRMKTADQSWLWVLSVGKAIYSDDCGLPIQVIGLNLDIQEIKSLQLQIEESYKASQIRTKEREALINSIPGLVFTIRLGDKSKIQYVSDQIFDLTGYQPQEFINQKASFFNTIIHPDDAAELQEHITQAVLQKGSYGMEYRLVDKGGRVRNVYGRGQAVYDNDSAAILYGTVLDVTERRSAEKRTKAILETAPDSMLVINNKRKILLVNAQTEKLFGYKTSELLDQCIEILLPKRYQENHPDHVANFFSSPTVRQMGSGRELWATRKDGTEFPVEISLSPLQTDDGLLVSAAVRDITDRKHAERELMQAKEIAEAATQAKSDFLANMSHEIRTPMNAIIGMSHLALQTELTPQQRNYIGKANKSAEDLLGIINDILDFSKIEAGKLDIEHIDFHIKSALEQFNNLVGMRAAEKDLELLVEMKDDVPSGLVGDPLRLGQILTNLGGNAVKFTHQGEITLMIELVRRKVDKVELKFSVTDTGIGMTDEHKGKLFQSFSQADTSTTREYGGTGLGLAISKKLTELMGGEIGVSSVKDEGSCFFFTAWFDISKSISEDNMTLPRHMNKLKVLLVDDNAHARDILSNIISSLGFDADTFADGYEALKQIKIQESLNQPYKVAIIDWMMPEMNGLTLTQKIQHDDSIQSPPSIIMATSYDREELSTAVDVAQVELAGIATKPLTPSNVFNSMLHALGHKQHNQMDEQSEYVQQKAAASSLSGAKILLVEDNQLNQELAIELLQNNNITVTLAENGAIALELLKQESFDGVLMDCQMPVMDGYDATIAIRKQKEFTQLPIIAMTANVMKKDIEKALNSGMNDHIGKPLNVSHMFETMAKWISSPQNSQTNITASPFPTIENNEFKKIQGINVHEGLKRTQYNSPLYTKLLRRFALSMVNFEQQFNQAKDMGTAKRLAHTLKGNAGNIGAESLQKAAEILEYNCDESINHSQKQLHLEAVLTQLGPVIAAINQALEPEQNMVDAAQFLSKAEVSKQFLKIRQLLEEYDTEAITLIEKLLSSSPDEISLLTLKSVQKSVNEYDFEAALVTLNDMSVDKTQC